MTTGFAVVLGTWIVPLQRENAALRELKQRGKIFHFEERSALPSWFPTFSGSDFFYHVTAIDGAGMRWTDVDAAALAQMPQLQQLRLSDNAITDVGALGLARLRCLKVLDLRSNPVTGDCLPTLAKLPQMELAEFDILLDEPALASIEANARPNTFQFGTDIQLNQVTDRGLQTAARVGIRPKFLKLVESRVSLAAISKFCDQETRTLVLEDSVLQSHEAGWCWKGAWLQISLDARAIGWEDLLNQTPITIDSLTLGPRTLELSYVGRKVTWYGPLSLDDRLRICARMRSNVLTLVVMDVAGFLLRLPVGENRELHIGGHRKGWPVTDIHLAILARWLTLERLEFHGTVDITSAGIHPLTALTNLKYLELGMAPQVEDAAVEHLLLMPELRIVNLRTTDVSESAKERLRQAGIEVK